MAQYANLKDYLSLNRKDEILKKANEYFQAQSDVKSNARLKDITIITVSCVEEIFPTAMVFIQVSAEIYNNNTTSVSSAYYSIKSAQSPAYYMNFFVLYAFSFGITAFAKLP